LVNVCTGLEESVPAATVPDVVVEDAPTVLPLVLEWGRVDIEGSLHPMTAKESMLNSALSLSFFALLKVRLWGPSKRFETEKTIVGVERPWVLSGKAKLKGPEGTPSSSAVKLEPFGDRSEVNETEVPLKSKVAKSVLDLVTCSV